MIKRKKLFGWRNSKNYPDCLARYRLLGLDIGVVISWTKSTFVNTFEQDFANLLSGQQYN